MKVPLVVALLAAETSAIRCPREDCSKCQTVLTGGMKHTNAVIGLFHMCKRKKHYAGCCRKFGIKIHRGAFVDRAFSMFVEPERAPEIPILEAPSICPPQVVVTQSPHLIFDING